MPSNSLAFSIGVGGEEDFFSGLGELGQFGDDFFFAFGNFVVGDKAARDVDGLLVVFWGSRTCPTDARTVYSPSRYLEIVFAFAGDSTMSNFLPVFRAKPCVAGASSAIAFIFPEDFFVELFCGIEAKYYIKEWSVASTRCVRGA